MYREQQKKSVTLLSHERFLFDNTFVVIITEVKVNCGVKIRDKMTLKKGEKSRWDYEYGAYDGPTKDWPIVSSRTAALISVVIVLGIVLKFVVVSSE